VRERAKSRRRWRAYIEIDKPYWTVGGADFTTEALKIAGVDNVFADLHRPAAQVSPELIVERNPDLIITVKDRRNRLSAREGWEMIEAVRTGAVIDDFSEDILSRPSVGLAAGMDSLIDRLDRLKRHP
jgi:ABC-type Fe3+-hydroxamate transport system substrate-binding protein